jgi:hypothetical protein
MTPSGLSILQNAKFIFIGFKKLKFWQFINDISYKHAKSQCEIIFVMLNKNDNK